MTRKSGWTRWLGLFGGIVVATGLLSAFAGAGREQIGSVWDYCGALTPSVSTTPCRCPAGYHQTTWPGNGIVCFSNAPDSGYLMADLGSAAAMVGALMVLFGNLLWFRRAGWTWLVIGSLLTMVASLFVAAVAVFLASPPLCLDCPSAPGDPAFSAAAVVTSLAALVVLAAALLPLGLRVVGSPAQLIN